MCAVRTNESAPPPPSSGWQTSADQTASTNQGADVCLSPAPRAGLNDLPWTRPLDLKDARRALEQVGELLEQGDGAHALLHLRVVERAMPRIADRIALRRGDLLRELGMPEEACEAYDIARQSPDRNVAVRARVGSVYCLLEAADRSGEKRLHELLRRYPHLSERELLRYKLALAKEAQGNRHGAAALLRAIDLQEPASPVSELARSELERLRSSGVKVAALSSTERLDRVERMLRWSPIEETLAELDALLEDKKLRPEQRARVHLLRAKVARTQGDWARVDAELAEARRQGVALPDAPRIAPPAAPPREPDDEARKVGERRVKAITRGRPLRKLTNAQLRILVDIAAQTGLKDVADEAIEAIAVRRTIQAGAKFDAAIRVSGLASDDKIAKLLEPVKDIPRFRLAGGYHYARALERAGRFGEAQAQYLRVYQLDRTETRYYAMWADLRMWAMQSEQARSCQPASVGTPGTDSEDDGAENKGEGHRSDTLAAIARMLDSQVPNEAPSSWNALQTGFAQEEDEEEEEDEVIPALAPTGVSLDDEQARAARRERVTALLEPVVKEHGDAYPWLARAIDLVQLSLFEEAADELNETYMAWRDAKGSPRLRAGLETVFTGEAPPKHPADFKLRRARLSLDRDRESRAALSKAAKLVGDPGVGLRFGDWRLGQRPRAYAGEVARAAKKYGVDPNLLFAVMRVESIYNRRIVSYAGAVGLMQIMPATGKRIADKLGVENFQTTDLLRPRTNLEFSAWYLASLLRRFDGSLPLAIASYNGGPHNVRLWMRASYPDMPLDAFLERIPFSQTHRYVRRVLTHYAAYRAQQNLPMTRLDTTLPETGPDPIAF